MNKKTAQASECFLSSLIPHPSSFLFIFPPFAFPLLLIIGVCIAIACGLVAALSRHKKSATGELRLAGRVALVVEALEPEGAVLVDGEWWWARARESDSIARGHVRVVGARGYWLEVEPIRASPARRA